MLHGRRNFLGTAGAAAVYSLSGAPAPSPAPVGANDQLGLGFIGVGIRGSGLMDEFSKNPAARFVSICDLYDGYLQHAREVCKNPVVTTKRYEDLLNRKDIDAVVIATPDHWHKKITLDALAAGKHVFFGEAEDSRAGGGAQ